MIQKIVFIFYSGKNWFILLWTEIIMIMAIYGDAFAKHLDIDFYLYEYSFCKVNIIKLSISNFVVINHFPLYNDLILYRSVNPINKN